jgi:hypothetical protein|tara:strand:+ start:414 stop:668 length:255 start_codon:yes stop_codon:yes gene_type:complete
MEYSMALDALRTATCGKDVKDVIDRYGQDECNKAWKQLSSLERTTLQFANAFQGTIIHDYNHDCREKERPRTTSRSSPRDEIEW